LFTSSKQYGVFYNVSRNVQGRNNKPHEIASKIDWEILDKLATDEDELRLITMSDRGHLDFKACYETFERRYRTCKD